MRLRVLGGAVLLGLVGWVSVALAGNGSSQTGYGGTGGQVQSGLTPSGGSGTLPFTGLNLMLIVLGALALLAVGVALRRMSRKQTS